MKKTFGDRIRDKTVTILRRTLVLIPIYLDGFMNHTISFGGRIILSKKSAIKGL
jgi:hypothetical protein